MSNYYETGTVPPHLPIVEDQPYVPRNGWTVGEAGGRAALEYTNHLPIVRRNTFDALVARAKQLLADLAHLTSKT